MQSLQTNAVEAKKSKDSINSQELQSPMQELQNALVVSEGEKRNLQKYNNNLQEIVKDRSLALTEMKKERNLRLEKFDALQIKHNQTIEKFYRKYYLIF